MENRNYLEYLEGVSRLKTTEQVKQAQLGTNTATGYFSTTDSKIIFPGSRTHEVYFRTGGDVTSEQRIFTNQPSVGNNLQLFIYNKALNCFIAGAGVRLLLEILPQTNYHVVLVLDTYKSSFQVYLNGELIREGDSLYNYNDPNTFILGSLTLVGTSLFNGVIYYTRIFNFPINKGIVNRLWNSGNPAKYILPSEFKNGVDNSLESTSPNTDSIQPQLVNVAPKDVDKYYWLKVENTVINKGVEFVIRGLKDVTNQNPPDHEGVDTYNTSPITVPAGETVTFTSYVKCFHDRATITLTITQPEGQLLYEWSAKTTIVGCAGEYLSQNIITEKSSTAEVTITSWVDSSKQLPPNDDYLPPLLESLGTKDLTVTNSPTLINK